jgi:serine/threonine-protein kinase
VSEPVDALLPVLVAELADADARKMVEELAKKRELAIVPLTDAPMDASLHVLEVTTPDDPEPLLVLAEPRGAPTEQGFPLRLHPYDSPPRGPSAHAPPSLEMPPLPNLRATRSRPATLTKHHTRDLVGDDRPPPATTASAEALIGYVIAEKLVVEALVGQGGMGSVYRARHKQLQTKLAVKVLHAHFRDDLQFCARFHAEALVVSQLDHPNVVRVIDYGQEPDGLLYLAMDYLEGVELHEVLRRAGTLPLPRIIDIGMQASAGLGHAHARGIIHRDVKPSNIVLVKNDNDDGEEFDQVKVCDFGIAARAGTSDLLGTPAYMSPEQCANLEIDGRSDIYSLGVIFYELATGQLPFSDDDERKVLRMQREAAPTPPSAVRKVDKRLDALIMRMLAKSPDERPQTMRELRYALRDLERPPSLQLHDVGVGHANRGSSPPDSSRNLEAAVATSAGSGSPHPPPAKSLGRIPAAPDVRGLAARLASEPVSTLRERLVTQERFIAEAQGLASAMRLLLEQRELAALAQVVAIFRKIAGDVANDPRAELAARLVRTLQDPARLAPVAEKALAEHDEAAPALLAGLGLAAAHALHAARVHAHPTPPVRGRFVAAMRGVGIQAWPLMAAALQRNAPGDNAQHDPRLAEDLLRAMPLGTDDACGGVVAKYLRWGDAAVRRAAVPPLVAMWGDRARPLLLAVFLKDADEGARVAAIRGLRDLHAIDEHVVRRADDMLAENSGSGSAVRVALAEALGDADASARPIAAAVLKRALVPKGGVFSVLRNRAPSAPTPVVLALACSYLTVGGAEAPKLVDELARQCEEPLRTQLLGAARTPTRH